MTGERQYGIYNYEILIRKKEEKRKKMYLKKALATAIIFILCALQTGCGSRFTDKGEPGDAEEETAGNHIIVGYSQLGAESDWRSENTNSMKSSSSSGSLVR